MGITEDVFQIEGKEWKDQKRLKMRKKASMPEKGKWFSTELATLSDSVAVEEKRLAAATKNLLEVRRKPKKE